MEIKEGMYVRTTYGRIYKIEKIETTKVYYSCNPPELQWQDRKFVYSKSGVECEDVFLKASHNIIDLIEVGDIVTLRSEYCEDEIYRVIYSDNGSIEVDCLGDGWMTINDDDIKQVLTKEQFAAMAYEVK